MPPRGPRPFPGAPRPLPPLPPVPSVPHVPSRPLSPVPARPLPPIPSQPSRSEPDTEVLDECPEGQDPNPSEGGNSPNKPRPPPSLNDYNILQRLGQGAYGKVFLVAKRPTDRQCALKLMPINRPDGRSNLPAFETEVQILSSIDHPFIIKLGSAFSCGPLLFIETEYVAGGTLADLLDETGSLSPKDAQFYLAQLASVLDYLHREGIVYRDLKPDNVLLDSEGYLKLIDFGVSKKVEHSRCSTPCGTPLYMAPEMFGPGIYDSSADWWALGVILYLMLTGSYPFCDMSDLERSDDEFYNQWYDSLAVSTQAGLQVLPSGLPEDCGFFLQRLLCGDPSQRHLDLETIAGLAWFSGFDWDSLREKKLTAPHITVPLQGGSQSPSDTS